MNLRWKLASFVIVGVFLVIISRLFYWQVIKGKELSLQAKNQYDSKKILEAGRGNIMASDGTWLVARGQAWLCYLTPSKVNLSSEKMAYTLAPILSGSSDPISVTNEEIRLKDLITKSTLSWLPLKRRVDTATKTNLEALGINGLGFEKEEIRVYPEASAAAHLLGFVGKDEGGADIGYFGLEGYYNLSLSGKSGYEVRETDPLDLPILLGISKKVQAIGGVDLITYLDKTVQLIIESKLKEGIEKYQALGGTVIVMRPNDGAILGMASYPSYDQSQYFDYSNELFSNPAIASSFEPGSVFKIIVMASALDAGVIEPQTTCDQCSGPVNVDKYSIETWDNKYYPNTNMTDIIVHSDNVGMVYVANRLGIDRMYDYLRKFGIGDLSKIDLQGESSPKLRDKDKWNIVDLATASFGQGVALTPIQMIRAAAVIANNGYLVDPKVVNKIAGVGWEEKINLSSPKQIISDKAANETKAMMIEAAKKGESKWTYLKGFSIAGKTGTAQIPIAGYYDKDKTIASFIGFSPASNAKFIMLVTLKEPKSSIWASETAAPLWYQIAGELFKYFGIQPEK